jgi:hypothetical protein
LIRRARCRVSTASISGPHTQVGSCNCFFGACSAFTHVMACTLAESLNDPLHRKLRQLCCLRRRFDCYRVERTSSRAGVPPAEVQRLSRRTVTPTRFLVASLEPVSGLSDAWLGYSVVPISRSAEWVRYRIQQPGRTRRPLPVGGKAVYILAAVRETKNLPATALPTRSRLRSEGGHLTTYSLTDTVITIACRKQ